MSKITILFQAVLLFQLLLSSCTAKQKNVVPQKAEKPSNTEFVKVIFFEVAGCGYMLQRQNQTRLQPMNLPEQYQVDGLELWVQYRIIQDVVTICMAGDVVEIIDIKKVE